MKIYCCSCAKYVGEIRDGRLMNQLGFICPDCRDEIIGYTNETVDEDPNYVVDFFKDVFGMKK